MQTSTLYPEPSPQCLFIVTFSSRNLHSAPQTVALVLDSTISMINRFLVTFNLSQSDQATCESTFTKCRCPCETTPQSSTAQARKALSRVHGNQLSKCVCINRSRKVARAKVNPLAPHAKSCIPCHVAFLSLSTSK